MRKSLNQILVEFDVETHRVWRDSDLDSDFNSEQYLINRSAQRDRIIESYKSSCESRSIGDIIKQCFTTFWNRQK